MIAHGGSYTNIHTPSDSYQAELTYKHYLKRTWKISAGRKIANFIVLKCLYIFPLNEKRKQIKITSIYK